MVSSTLVDSSLFELTGDFAALAGPVRLRTVGVLAEGVRCVCDPHEQMPVAASLLSCHLRVLPDAGLVIAARRGRRADYHLDSGGFAALWAQASAAGAPVPGDRVGTGWCRPPCQEETGNELR